MVHDGKSHIDYSACRAGHGHVIPESLTFFANIIFSKQPSWYVQHIEPLIIDTCNVCVYPFLL